MLQPSPVITLTMRRGYGIPKRVRGKHHKLLKINIIADLQLNSVSSNNIALFVISHFGERMSISATSYVANVAGHLQQLSDMRQQQIDIDLKVGEASMRARQQVAEQSLQELTKQAERVNEIKKAALQSRSNHGGQIDVWA